MNNKVVGLVAILLSLVLACGLGCAPAKEVEEVTEVLPNEVTIEYVQLMTSRTEKPYNVDQALALRLALRVNNPNDVLARVDRLEYALFVDGGPGGRTNLLSDGQYFDIYIPGKTSVVLKDGSAIAFMTVAVSYMLGVGGDWNAEATALFDDIDAGEKVFKLEGSVTTSLPEHPDLGSKTSSFATQYLP